MAITLYDELADTILAESDFTSDAQRLFRAYFASRLGPGPALEAIGAVGLEAKRISQLCEAAAIFACSTDLGYRRLAYDLITQLYETYGATYQSIAAVGRLVLARTGNIPSMDMVADPDASPLPIGPQVQTLARAEANTREVNGQRRAFTDFQRDVWDRLREGRSVSLSAPTSAGKTYVISAHVVSEFLAHESFSAAVIVPTRALIRQLAQGLFDEFARYGVANVHVWTTVVAAPEQIDARNLFVMTQERLQVVLSSWPQVPEFNLIVVDEAQKIAEDARGVLLEDTVAELAARNPAAQLVFLTPSARNPEKLLRIFGKPETGAVRGELSPVTQYVYSVPVKKKRIKVRLLREGLGSIDILDYAPAQDVPSKKAESLAFVANELARGKPSLVYANGPSEAENLAEALRPYKPSNQPSDAVNKTISAIREYVHEQYSLVRCLADGVAYHYSAMPDIAKLAVEDLFTSNEISYVACTSTLLEGVNFPASNVFIAYPRQGPGNPMPDSAFWNLAGRAGRLLKDFAGNVYCVDQEKWDRPVTERSRDYSLESAFENTVVDSQFVDFLRESDAAPVRKKDGFTTALNSVLARVDTTSDREIAEYLSERVPDIGHQEKTLVAALTQTIAEDLVIDVQQIRKNRSVDARRQNAVARDFLQWPRERIELLIPLHPQRPEFFDQLVRIFAFLADRLSVGTPASARYFALLAMNWVRERTLRTLINNRLSFVKSRSDGEINIDEQVRGLIRDIEGVIRYELVKGTKCLLDLIQFAFEKRGWEKSVGADYGLPSYLELGMHQAATITLHNLGVSRTTSILATQWARSNKVKEEEIVRWLASHVGQLDAAMPRPSARELQAVFNDVGAMGI